jgi:hypothetical protein
MLSANPLCEDHYRSIVWTATLRVMTGSETIALKTSAPSIRHRSRPRLQPRHSGTSLPESSSTDRNELFLDICEFVEVLALVGHVALERTVFKMQVKFENTQPYSKYWPIFHPQQLQDGMNSS